MQTIAPPPPRHFAAGELINNDNLVVLEHVLHVFLEQAVRFQQLRDVVNALGLRVAILLALRFLLVLLFIGQSRIEIDLGEFVD